MSKTMDLKLKIWRQKGPGEKGSFLDFEAKDISGDMSFLEMMDMVNQQLIQKGVDVVSTLR